MEPSRESDRSGAVVDGKWRLEQKIGSGGMGSVYAAVHLRTHKRVAVKFLRSAVADREAVARFQREGYVSNMIDDPGVVAVFDDGFAEGGAYLVMELLDGASIEDLANAHGGTLAVSEVLRLTHAALVILAKAHAAGVVHRDLKPSNLFVMRSGQVKILDFGLAGIMHRPELRMTSQKTPMMGTLGFMPPEQAQGDWERVGAASDVWAMGATMYALLTGLCPHEDGAGNMQFLKRAMLDPVPPIHARMPALSSRVARIVDRALKYDAAERYANAGEMASALAGVMDLADDGPISPLSSGEAPTMPALPVLEAPAGTPSREPHEARERTLRSSDDAPLAGGRPAKPAEPSSARATSPSGAVTAGSGGTSAPVGDHLLSIGGVASTRRPRGRARWPIAAALLALAAVAGGAVYWLSRSQAGAVDGERHPGASSTPTAASAEPHAVAPPPTATSTASVPVVTLSELPQPPRVVADDPRRPAPSATVRAPPIGTDVSPIPTAKSATRPAETSTAGAASAPLPPPPPSGKPPIDLDRRH